MSQTIPYPQALERLLAVNQKLSKARDLAAVMDVVRHATRELTGADGATFILREGDQTYYAEEDAIKPLFRGKRFPMAKCIGGWVILHHKAAVIDDVFADPRTPPEVYEPTFVKSLIVVPMRREDPLGAVGAYWAETRKHARETVRVLQALADTASVAMANVRLYGELESRLAELERQKARAEAANRAKGDFLASMSHELRTPLNGVLGMTELAGMACRHAECGRYLRLIRQSGQSLLDIVNDILDYSKIEAGKLELTPAAFDIRESLTGLLEPLSLNAAGKGLGLVRSVDKDVPARLIGDQGRLRQVLANLVVNALKFTERGEVVVAVSVAEEGRDSPPPGPGLVRLRFAVSDTGVGIPPDKLEAIFESFSQVGGSAHAKYGGVGLGLAISKRIVEMMGGRIEARSEAGKGSEFVFTALFGLPEDEADEREATAEAGQARLEKMAEASSLRLLLAEDNLVNQTLMTALLERLGHAVVVASNGKEALARLAEDRFDAVIMDVRMPEMSGEETVRVIRSDPPPGVDSSIPVIALTAHALKGDRERFLAAGMDGYLSKPVDIEELKAELRRVAERKRGAA